MHTIEELQAVLAEAVNAKTYPQQPAELYEPISYLLAMSGKRMRPVLLLMGCELFNGDIKKAIDPALAVEVFHNFTLMHDDIMDKAPLRRGKQTVHEKWNVNIAILSGDVMLVQGYILLLNSLEEKLLRPVLRVFNETAVSVCEGQQFDMNFEIQSNVSLPDYIEMIRLKTAVLLGGSLKIGALIAGASTAESDLLEGFGEDLGIAFQIQDDILDVYGNPDKFGKQLAGDILANKKTYLLIKAQELAKENDADELTYWLEASNYQADEKIKAITELYNRLGVRELAETAMQDYAKKAIEQLDKIQVDPIRKEALGSFAAQLLLREQ
ncbi:MAG: polyprenyl synthetase family protein [Sphingobacteriaceae bacterium]